MHTPPNKPKKFRDTEQQENNDYCLINYKVSSHGTSVPIEQFEAIKALHQQFYDIIDQILINNSEIKDQSEICDINSVSTEWNSLFCPIKLAKPETPDFKHNIKPVYQSLLETPKFKIPIFSGNFHDWINFHNLFKGSVHENSQLSSEQKLQILRTHLSGNALLLIESLPISAENYQVAYDILISRYDNKHSLLNSFYSRIKCFQSDDRKNYLSNFKATYISLLMR
ncbi:uncharacterized protein LOC142322603 [Lycorma delicatula]|uniref:uncharacterized protein LOC142322603 n=1 Tax=Lycorma delicatula TaxID=130591 RepID=UPI003F5181E4